MLLTLIKIPQKKVQNLSLSYFLVHVLPAEKFCAARHDFKGEALSSIDTVVLLTVTAACHMTGCLCCCGRAGGSCRGHPLLVQENNTKTISIYERVNS